jgi:hypothetical protein
LIPPPDPFASHSSKRPDSEHPAVRNDGAEEEE